MAAQTAASRIVRHAHRQRGILREPAATAGPRRFGGPRRPDRDSLSLHAARLQWPLQRGKSRRTGADHELHRRKNTPDPGTLWGAVARLAATERAHGQPGKSLD